MSEQTWETDKLPARIAGKVEKYRKKKCQKAREPGSQGARKPGKDLNRKLVRKAEASPFKWRTHGLMLSDIFGAWFMQHSPTLHYKNTIHCAAWWHLSGCWRSGNLTSLTTKRGNHHPEKSGSEYAPFSMWHDTHSPTLPHSIWNPPISPQSMPQLSPPALTNLP